MKHNYAKQWFCNAFFQQIPFKLFLSLLVRPHWTSLLFQFNFLFKYFPSCLCAVKILRTRKLYPVRFITQLTLCHRTCVMICPARLATQLESKCNSFCTSIRVATSNYSKRFSIIRNDLRLPEMNSSHLKTVSTRLALRPLHIILKNVKHVRRDVFHLWIKCLYEKCCPD